MLAQLLHRQLAQAPGTNESTPPLMPSTRALQPD